jgi:sensor histidine kinase regulating citrate/malate metabolism
MTISAAATWRNSSVISPIEYPIVATYDVRTRDRLRVLSMRVTGLAVLLILIGALVLAGFDKHLETVLVNATPQWLTDLTTRF